MGENMLFSGGGGGGEIRLPENCIVIFPWGNSSSGKS